MSLWVPGKSPFVKAVSTIKLIVGMTWAAAGSMGRTRMLAYIYMSVNIPAPWILWGMERTLCTNNSNMLESDYCDFNRHIHFLTKKQKCFAKKISDQTIKTS